VILQCTDAQRLLIKDRASRIVVSTLRPMQCITMDTIGQLPELMTFKFIIVFELFPTNTVCAISAANALWKHICRSCTPLEILTDQGTQFMNQTLTHLASISIYLIKEVNRNIRNILADKNCMPDWPQMLCMTKNSLAAPLKKPSVCP